MKVLYVFLISIVVTSSTSYHVEPILRQENILADGGQYKFGFNSRNQNVEQFRGSDGIIRGSFSYLDDTGKVQFMEYIAGPNGYHVYNANLPLTVASVTETPEVEAARKAHEETYNYLKSVALAQKRMPPILQNNVPYQQPEAKEVRYMTETPIAIPTTTSIPFVQSYLESSANYPLKNRYATLEDVRRPIAETQPPSPSYNYATRNNYHPIVTNTPSPIPYSPKSVYKPVEANTRTPVQAASPPKITAESHLEALRNAIAAQLVSYRNVPSETFQDDAVLDEPRYSPAYKTELYSPVKVENYVPDTVAKLIEPEVERDRKLAIIAAEKALMKILYGK